MQRKYFGYEFLDDSDLAGKIVRNLKDRFYGDSLEDTEEESEDSWLSSILEDLAEDEPGQRSKRANGLRPELT